MRKERKLLPCGRLVQNRHKSQRGWIIASNVIQYCEQIPSTRDVFPCKAWLEGTNSFYPKTLVVAQWLIRVKTRKPVFKILIEVALQTFWKFSTSSCHEVPNELSNLLDSNCQSKCQFSHGSLQSSHQIKSIRFDCNIFFKLLITILTGHALVQLHPGNSAYQKVWLKTFCISSSPLSR